MFIRDHLGALLGAIAAVIEFSVEELEGLLALSPPLLLMVLLAALAWYLAGYGPALFTLLGMFLIHNFGLWDFALATLAMILVAAAVALLLGVPIGILCARSDLANNMVRPVLDLMQTLPPFVYLIPAVFFFGVGRVPGVIATVIFAMPPPIRLTNLGIRQVPVELIEAADAFGSTARQKLLKVQLPVAKPTIMAGVNQCIMLALSMVVIAAMIGGGGLGQQVLRGITRLNIGLGAEAGLGVVIVAIILDRITESLGQRNKQGTKT